MKTSYSLDRERLVMKKTDWPIRWDLLLRYRLIETIALWEGRILWFVPATAGICGHGATQTGNSGISP